jgi:protocatechuate 3,4-dioxygenase beta subunit
MTHEHDRTVTRRGVLQLGAAGAVLGALGRPAQATDPCSQSPAQTAGPYWVDEMLLRSDIRSDPATGVVEAGFPLRFALNVSEITSGQCLPASGLWVDVWHCNALGIYSDVAAQGSLGKKFLRGYQLTDNHGNVRFLSIYPGYYPGRTVHIHFRVRRIVNNVTTFNYVSQLYFNDTLTTNIFNREPPYNTRPPRTTFNSNDGIYQQGGPQLLFRQADNITHAIASANIVVNETPGFAAGRPIKPELERLLSPTDEDSMEHLNDFGGGTPPSAFA